jgi:hypothetical protein
VIGREGQMVVADLAGVAGAVAPGSVVVWSGAGVSVEGPASLPTGWELTRRVFGAFFDEDALETVLAHHRGVGWWQVAACPQDRNGRPGPRPPRLETVLGVAARVHGDDAVHGILADAWDAEPNRMHGFFAAHLDRGGRHVTANFDACIERAADAWFPGWRSRGTVHHFHGSVADDLSGHLLGATLQRIEGGFDADQAAALRRMLPERGVLLVAGYSGSDFFDVDTAIAALPPSALAQVRVAWVFHSDHDWHRIDPAETGVPPLAGLLQQAGAQVDLACGPTSDLLGEIARRWGMAGLGPAAARTPRVPVIATGDTLRREATFQLYRELGLIGEVARLARPGAQPRTDRAQLWQARSEVLWEQGKWDVLRLMWRQPAARALIPAAVCDERIGAALWVQGRLLPAYLWLTWHRRRCPDPGLALMLAETEGRVIEHMARVPELRPLARRLAPRMIATLGSTTQAAGVHLYRRRNDLASSLRSITGTPRPATEAETSSRWFTEAGSLLAALNYRHRRYRDTYHAAAITDAELADRYRELQQHFDSIGSPSGRWRTHLLPGAERVFPATEIIHGMLALQYGWWHRARLLTRYLALRIRHHLRRAAARKSRLTR